MLLAADPLPEWHPSGDPTWKFLLTSVFLSDSICRNFERSPLIWLSILMMYWKSRCVRRFSTSIDCDMFCTFWNQWDSVALIFPSAARLKCPPCSAAARLNLPDTLTSNVIGFWPTLVNEALEWCYTAHSFHFPLQDHILWSIWRWLDSFVSRQPNQSWSWQWAEAATARLNFWWFKVDTLGISL